MSRKLSIDVDVEKQLGVIKYSVEPNKIEKLFVGIELPFHYFIERNKHCVIPIVVIYLVVIFSLQRYMRDRPAYSLRYVMTLWNAFIAAFSWMGMARTAPELVHILRNHGIHHAICHPNCFYGPVGFWTIIFCLSKPVELGDTLFIVLRKQKLIFLHWYHHATVLLYCWYGFPTHSGGGRVFMVMNYFVHSIMYSYYTLRALRFKMARYVSITITLIQITQMLLGTFINVYLFLVDNKAKDTYCTVSDNILYVSFVIYSSYLVLFVNYFYKHYIETETSHIIAIVPNENTEDDITSRKTV